MAGWSRWIALVGYAHNFARLPKFALGHRFDEYTITAVHEKYSQDVDYSTLNEVQNPVLQAAGRVVYDFLGSREFNINSLNLRWDFHSNAALKVDYFRGFKQ